MSAEGSGGFREAWRTRRAVPGLLAWALIMLSVAGALWAPRAMLATVVALSLYFLVRLLAIAACNVVGWLRCRRWERLPVFADVGSGLGAGDGLAPEDAHHIVVIPNYKESEDVLEDTLDALAMQEGASERLTVVLAMEEREEGAREKAERLAARFTDRIARVLVTLHPVDRPGEISGKASNEAWGARIAAGYVTGELGVARDRVTVTSCDADSRLHPRYLEALGQLFATDERRYRMFWQAPYQYYTNLWDVPAPVRFVCYGAHLAQMGDLVMPWYTPLPISTYSLSLTLLERMGYWDTDIVSEDWHSFLQAFLATDGEVGLTPIYLSTHACAADGDTWWEAIRNRYLQSLRHAWGAEDAAYLMREWRTGEIPVRKRVFRLVQVTHDHVMRSVPFFVFVAGAVLTWVYAGTDVVSLMGYVELSWMRVLGVAWVCAAVSMFAIEFVRRPPPARHAPLLVAEMVVTWFALPLVGFGLGTVPALHAQTKLIMGKGLAWQVTPKREATIVRQPVPSVSPAISSGPPK